MMTKKILAVLVFVASFSTFTAPDCRKTGTVCTAPNQTRNMSDPSVFRGCWEYQGTYQCRSQNMASDCQPLRDRGCFRIGSSCVERDDSSTCVVYEQKYSCPDKPETYIEKAVYDRSAFYQDGEAGCFDISAPSDKDFGQAIVMMGAVREAGVHGIDPNEVEIFEGYTEECSIKVLDGTALRSHCKSAGGGVAFSNYVLLGVGVKVADETGRESIVLGSRYIYDSLYGQLDSSLVDKGLGAMNSWTSGLGDGIFNPQFEFYGFTSELTFVNGFQLVGLGPYSFALSVVVVLMQEWLSCDSAKQVMAMKRSQNLCVHIETYCSKGVLKVRTEKRECHCRFNSKPAKIINHQGRAQPGIPTNSRSGFNQAQLQALDSSRIGLSKFIADIVPKDVPTSIIGNRVQQTVNKKVQSYCDQ